MYGRMIPISRVPDLLIEESRSIAAYYNKAGNTQRLALAQPLASTLDKNFKPDSLLNFSE